MGDVQGVKDTVNIFLKAVNGVIKHPSLQFHLQDAREMKNLHNQVAEDQSAMQVSKLVHHLDFITIRNLNNLQSAFHSVVSSGNAFKDFQVLLKTYEVILLQERIVFWVLMDQLRQVIILNLKEHEGPTASLQEKPLDDTELRTLRYVSGFMLRKQLRKSDRDVKDFLEQFLDNPEILQDDEDDEGDEDFLGYTKALVEGRDRGGLIKVNDDFFLFFVTLEKICKALFQCISTKPTKSIILKKMQASDLARETWGNMSGESHEKLFDELIDKYATLRIKAYAESFNYLNMKRSRINKSLRKTLE